MEQKSKLLVALLALSFVNWVALNYYCTLNVSSKLFDVHIFGYELNYAKQLITNLSEQEIETYRSMYTGLDLTMPILMFLDATIVISMLYPYGSVSGALAHLCPLLFLIFELLENHALYTVLTLYITNKPYDINTITIESLLTNASFYTSSKFLTLSKSSQL
ncbi:hypothetical protein SAMD00019534_099070 [Acytostelium subglobosum LB1]|uniref:hypothetical protein n=1 Tax=Acytostelium subglobosum LB1 TaxID=1410327 RepID=UPI0006450851|nr:hypothetical protein SAMD00019534_099070 [Acytostelium subglobosum LB1]GAM26732.1 hypothetical protein SAMD00019534_099070 [Acytostelium subglobosum LB1]|eukprot:XP_012750393.1 hypothetical protein SAMD00019534_099070 [Acytostelium subglobosum LB1]